MANDVNHTYKPLRLVKNIRYPNYQLYAIAGQGKKSTDNVLKIAILETLQWLRERFREFELPPELDMPAPSAYKEVNLNELESFQIDEGYKVEVLWIPDERVWALQLIEPDQGPNPGEEEQIRPPAPGRLIETNIAFRVYDGQVECGFRTIISDPEGTTLRCEVFRLAVIKYLARNGNVGLYHGYPLLDHPINLNSNADTRGFLSWLRDKNRMMAAVVCIEKGTSTISPERMPVPSDILPTNAIFGKPMIVLPVTPIVKFEESGFSVDVNRLSRYKMGYAQFFTLPFSQLELFNNFTGLNAEGEDVLICEPFAYGGDVIRYASSDIVKDPSAFYEKLDTMIQNYPKHKPMSFGNILFLPAAKELDRKKLLESGASSEDVVRLYSEKELALNAKHRDEVMKNTQELEQRDRRIINQSDRIKDLERIISDLKDSSAHRDKQHSAELKKKDDEIGRLISRINRPATPAEVVEWVNKNFQGRMFFHPKACSLIAKVEPHEIDMPLLCDALEYLATDYRDAVLGLLSEDGLNDRCSKKYNRPFEVTSTKSVSVERYPIEYKIKYDKGYNGRLVETMLDRHLKVGNSSDRLIRIYFLFDKEKKLIVVGSLPYHLPIVSYK